MSCQSSGRVHSYPVPVRGPDQPSRPNPAWGLNAQNHIKCIFVIAVVVLPAAVLFLPCAGKHRVTRKPGQGRRGVPCYDRDRIDYRRHPMVTLEFHDPSGGSK